MTKTATEPTLTDAAFTRLADIVGSDNVSRDPAFMDTYSRHFGADRFEGTRWTPRPVAVVLPGTTEEIQGVVRLCNEEGLQFKALSTGLGPFAAPGGPGVVQIDLRRMDRILEIDARNMYAVIEPYVVGATLQAEAQKVALTCHIIGAGSSTSVLASSTSLMGNGPMGLWTGFNNRNLLGVEWVTPTGDVVRLGSFNSSGRWFTGDGPGPSMRGVIRGFAGACGGLGVFTKCAVKLYPWPGGRAPEIAGESPHYRARMPENWRAYAVALPSWKAFADFGLQVAEAEIGFALNRVAPTLVVAALSRDNIEYYKLWKLGFFERINHIYLYASGANSPRELDYQEGAFREIVDACGGAIISTAGLDLQSVRYVGRLAKMIAGSSGRTATGGSGKATKPGPAKAPRKLNAAATLARAAPFMAGLLGRRQEREASTDMVFTFLTKASNNALIFRAGGSFTTSMAAIEAWDACIEGAKAYIDVKRPYVDSGALLDDGGDNAYGGIYEGGALGGHIEGMAAYDPHDPDSRKGVREFCFDTVRVSIEKALGQGIYSGGPVVHALYGPRSCNYDRWLRGIKNAFDPNGASEYSTYIGPDEIDAESAIAEMRRSE